MSPRWQAANTLEARVSASGWAFRLKCQHPDEDIFVRATIGRPFVTYTPATRDGLTAVLEGHSIRLQDAAGKTVASREDPRRFFPYGRRLFWWDALDRSYFSAYALWNYMTFPSLLLRDDITVHRAAGQPARSHLPGHAAHPLAAPGISHRRRRPAGAARLHGGGLRQVGLGGESGIGELVLGRHALSVAPARHPDRSRATNRFRIPYWWIFMFATYGCCEGQHTMNPIVFKIAHVIVPPIGKVLCAPVGYGDIACIESNNKISTIESVEFANDFLGGDAPVAELVKRIEASDPFRGLWLGEGLGLQLGLRSLKSTSTRRICSPRETGQAIPQHLLLMAHAGMALGFARHHLDAIGKNPPAGAVQEATRKTAELIEANGIPGFSGISYEAWGMVTTFFYRKQLTTVIDAMEKIDPARVPWMWHGVGRACYFLNFMPRWKEPWPAFLLMEEMGTEPVRRANLFAGLAAAMVLVNMKTPKVLESVIRERISHLSATDQASYAQGIACSMVMREDTTPGDMASRNLVAHQPPAEIAEVWKSVIATPGGLGLETIRPLLRSRQQLDKITRFCPLEEVMAAG